MVFDIKAGKTPADWDGHELRQLLADKFAEATSKLVPHRIRAYKNVVLVNNL